MFRPLSYDVHISEHGHLGTSCGMQVTGKVVEAGWGCEECSLWNNELITLLTSGGGKKEKVCSAQVHLWDCPSGLSHPLCLCSGWSCPLVEETGICTIWSGLKSSCSGVSRSAGLLRLPPLSLAPAVVFLFRYPPTHVTTRGIFPQCCTSVSCLGSQA